MSAAAAIDTALRRMQRRRQRVRGVRAMIRGLAACAAWTLAAAVGDRWLHLSTPARAVTAGVAVVGLALTAAWAIGQAMSNKFDAVAAARRAEAADPAWGERLLTAVTQARLPAAYRGSAAMNAALADAVAAELRERPPAARIRLSAVRPAVSWLGMAGLAWAIAFTVPVLEMPRLIERQLRPLADLPPVTGTQIDLLPHADAVPQGRSLAVVADVSGDEGAVVMHVGPNLSDLRDVPMDRTYARRYTTTLLALQQDLVYRVTAGDAAAGPVYVRVLRTPGVSRLDVTLTSPDGRPPVARADSDGRLRAAAGTRVGVTFTVTEPVERATVHVGAAVIEAHADVDRRVWRADFVADAEADWSIGLIGERGVTGEGPGGMHITLDPPAN